MPGSQSYVALLLLFTNAIRICSFWRKKKKTCGKLDSVAKFNTYIFVETDIQLAAIHEKSL